MERRAATGELEFQLKLRGAHTIVSGKRRRSHRGEGGGALREEVKMRYGSNESRKPRCAKRRVLPFVHVSVRSGAAQQDIYTSEKITFDLYNEAKQCQGRGAVEKEKRTT